MAGYQFKSKTLQAIQANKAKQDGVTASEIDAAEQMLRANGYTVIPPAKPLTFEDDLRHQPPLMTATEINALPHKAREYIHQLEANTDPSGMVRENMQLLDTNKGLQIMYRNRTDELDRVKQALAARHIFGLKGGEL